MRPPACIWSADGTCCRAGQRDRPQLSGLPAAHALGRASQGRRDALAGRVLNSSRDVPKSVARIAHVP